MDTIWKWIMHLNAKAFCLLAVLLFFATAAWCGFKCRTRSEPFQDGSEKPPAPPQAAELGTLAFVSNQLAAETLSIPTDPFRPTLEAIFTNETERAAFIKALKAAQAAAAGGAAGGTGADGKKEDPFAHLRKKAAVPDGTLVDAAGRPMVIPKLSFLGFVQRPDGTKAAMFHDSVENSTVFYESGKQQVRGVDILNADVRHAEIRFPDGSTRQLEIGGSVELAPEPAKAPPPKPAAKPAAAKPGAAAAKPGAANARPAAKPKK
jgi:hypothetical protein